MASKQQLEKAIALNQDIKSLQIKASNEFGIVSTANSEIINTISSVCSTLSTTTDRQSLETFLRLPEGQGLEWSKSFLTSKGFDTSKINLEDLLTNAEIAAIETEVNRPLIGRLRWDKWDYIIAFSAAIIGATADFMWGDPTKGLSAYLSDKNTLVGGWFGKIHSMHHAGSPLDYQGYKMGGGNHRLRSIGHDLFGFLEGIWQIKNGTFTGGYFKDGKWIEIISDKNQFSTPYEKFSQMEAIWRYTVHVFCDFFSTKSLPVPGFGYLARMPIREVRIFAEEMYNKGYNLRHMFVQALSILIIETIIRIFIELKYRNIDVQKDSLKLKQREMLMMAHCLVTSFNVGKVVVTKNPLLINFPQISFTCLKIWPFILDHYRRNNRIQIMLRNIDEISEEAQLKYEKSLSITLSSPEFGFFLNEKSIIL